MAHNKLKAIEAEKKAIKAMKKKRQWDYDISSIPYNSICYSGREKPQWIVDSSIRTGRPARQDDKLNKNTKKSYCLLLKYYAPYAYKKELRHALNQKSSNIEFRKSAGNCNPRKKILH